MQGIILENVRNPFSFIATFANKKLVDSIVEKGLIAIAIEFAPNDHYSYELQKHNESSIKIIL